MARHEFSVGQSSDWFTPPEYFDALGLTFDLDLLAWTGGIGCPRRGLYTKADDGLRQPWHGLVFMNPPFGGRRGHVPWLHKFFVHGNGIALVAARTSSDWFHEVVVPAAPLFCFPNEPGTGVVLLGMGDVACATLRRSGLGVCMVIDSEDF